MPPYVFGMGTMGERLREARIKAGYSSASAAAKAHGWVVSSYTAHENGQNDYNSEQAELYGRLYKVSPEWLLFGREIKAGKSPGIDAQLVLLPEKDAKALIDRFNAMIEGVRIIGKVR